MARLINDTESLRDLITSGSFAILIDLFFIISCLFSFLMINKIMGGLLSFAEIAAAGFLLWVGRYMRKIFLSVRQSRGMLSRALSNIVGGLSENILYKTWRLCFKKRDLLFC